MKDFFIKYKFAVLALIFSSVFFIFYVLNVKKNEIKEYELDVQLSDVSSLSEDNSNLDQHCDDNYAKDLNNVYWNSHVIDGADPDSFKALDYEYSLDKKHVYSYGKILDGNFDLDTFKVFNYSYIADKNGIYFYNSMPKKLKKVEEADVETFEIMIGEYDGFGFGSEHFAKDNKNIYYYGEKIGYIDVNTFVILDELYSKDKNSVYFQGRKIEGVDVETFEIIDNNESSNEYSKDKRNVYYSGEKIKGADVESFKILNHFYSRDNANCYMYNKMVDMSECENLNK